MKKKNHRQRLLTGLGAAFLMTTAISVGTFAWQNRTQTGLNETVLDIMPGGGRIHDDWNGTNKDVYAENYTGKDADGNGLDPVNLFVRIRLAEYMETGKDAGQEAETETDGSLLERIAEPVLAEDNDTALVWNNADTWRVRKPDDTSEDNPFLCYWEWVYGTKNSSTIYMPTFNKNSDSLAVDVNGTYEGQNGIPYDDYETYADGQTEETEAYYDADDNLDDEDTSMPGNGGLLHTNYEEIQETHTAKRTQTSEVITMAEWTDTTSSYYHKFGNFWVWDKDGWFYWARPLFAGETTGLLLDAVKQKVYSGDNTFYGIHVIGEFATAEDFGAPEDTDNGIQASGFHKNGITENAEELLENIKGIVLGANGKDLYKNCGYNVYKKIDSATGALGTAVCAGKDQIIGNSDDKDNVTERKEDLELNGKNHGKYLLKEKDGVYYVMGDNELLGTDEDKKLWYTETGNVQNDADEENYSFDAPTVTITPLGTYPFQLENTAQFKVNISFANGRSFSQENKRYTCTLSGNTNSATKVQQSFEHERNWYVYVWIAKAEAGNTGIKLNAELNGYPELSAEFTIQIIEPDSVVISESSGKSQVEPGTSLSFTATVKSGITTYPIENVTWSLVDGAGNSLTSLTGVTLNRTSGNQTGLDIDASATVGTIYVRATSNVKNDVYADYKVTILGPDTITITLDTDNSQMKDGSGLKFKVAVTRNGSTYAGESVIWSVTRMDGATCKNQTKIDSTGNLTIDPDEPTKKNLKVTATSINDPTKSATWILGEKITAVAYIPFVKVKTIETVKIDAYDYYVLAKDGTSYFLWSKQGVITEVMDIIEGESGKWESYDELIIHDYLNSDFLNSLSVDLKSKIVQKTYYTRKSWNDESKSYQAYVKILTGPDVFGTTWSPKQGTTTINTWQYTIPSLGRIVTDEIIEDIYDNNQGISLAWLDEWPDIYNNNGYWYGYGDYGNKCLIQTKRATTKLPAQAAMWVKF